ncbi:hypothetical protein EK904_000049 [Melospiza melodia maxima]|nr:hypothetical protein EK904_000049 [Melospiza melodia maxima]
MGTKHRTAACYSVLATFQENVRYSNPLEIVRLLIHRMAFPHQHQIRNREGTDRQSCACTLILRVATTALAQPERREITLSPSFDKQKEKTPGGLAVHYLSSFSAPGPDLQVLPSGTAHTERCRKRPQDTNLKSGSRLTSPLRKTFPFLPTKENLPVPPIAVSPAKGAVLKTKLGCSVSPLQADWSDTFFHSSVGFTVTSVCSDFGEMFLGLWMKTTAIPPPSPPCISPLSPDTLSTRSHCQTSQMQKFCITVKFPAEVFFFLSPTEIRARDSLALSPSASVTGDRGSPSLNNPCHFTRSKGGTRGPSSAGYFLVVLVSCLSTGWRRAATELTQSRSDLLSQPHFTENNASVLACSKALYLFLFVMQNKSRLALCSCQTQGSCNEHLLLVLPACHEDQTLKLLCKNLSRFDIHKNKYQTDPKPNDMHLYSHFSCANSFSFIWIAEVNIAVTKLEEILCQKASLSHVMSYLFVEHWLLQSIKQKPDAFIFSLFPNALAY